METIVENKINICLTIKNELKERKEIGHKIKKID